MKTRLLYSITLLLHAGMLLAQESPVKTTIGAFQDYTENHPVEKIYLHLDKPYYAAGEYLYFRAYLTDINLNQENAVSKIIYVELSDAKKNLVKRSLLYSEQQEFAGQILLPDSLPSANYHLRAYTNWMRNAGEDYFYHRDIYIGNTSEKKQEAPLQTFDYSVTFFPEGGQLLGGFSNKIAFKALGNDGFSTEITGVLTDSEGSELLQFHSVHLGMGAFNFTPEKGKTYQATVQSNGISKTYPLPAATEGLALSARQDEQSVILTIRSTNTHPDSIYIIGQSRHTVCYALEGLTKDREQKIIVDKTKFPTGIAQFILFKDGRPVSERLLFIDRKDDLHIDITPDKEEYGDREKATVRIQVTDNSGQPVEGSFSLSVTDDKTVQPSFDTQNIEGSLLLDSDLKGYIESPGWYFAGNELDRTEALDNLLCTQGWSRFVWNKLPASEESAYPAEKEFQITGKVTNLFKQPVKEASVILLGTKNIPGTTTTDADGRFGFYGFNCPEGSEFVLQCRTKRDRKAMIGFALDKPTNVYTPTTVIPITPTENKQNQALLEVYTEQAGHWNGQQMIQLPEVKIETQRVPLHRESFGISSYRLGEKALDRPYPLSTILQASPSITRGVNWQNVMYIVDDMMMDADEFKYSYGLMPAKMFESVEILRDVDSFACYGFAASGGAYVIKTKIYNGNSEVPDASIEVYSPEGYCVRKEFYVPDYDQPGMKNDSTPDLRTTIYWNPEVRTDKEGKAQVRFFTGDDTVSYSYVLEGIGDDKIGFAKK